MSMGISSWEALQLLQLLRRAAAGAVHRRTGKLGTWCVWLCLYVSGFFP